MSSESLASRSSIASSIPPDTVEVALSMVCEAEKAVEATRRAQSEQAKIKPGTKGGGKAAKKAVADSYKAAKLMFALRKKQLDDIISRQETASAIARCNLHSTVSTTATSLNAATAISSASASYVQSMLEVDSTSSTASSEDEDMVEDHVMDMAEEDISTESTGSITVQVTDPDKVAEVEPDMAIPAATPARTMVSPNSDKPEEVAEVQPAMLSQAGTPNLLQQNAVESRDTDMADVTTSSTATPATPTTISPAAVFGMPMDLLSMPDLHHDSDQDEDADADDDDEDDANAEDDDAGDNDDEDNSNANANSNSDDDDSDDDSSENGGYHGSVPRLTRIPVFLRKNGEKKSNSNDRENDGMNFADFADMHPDDQELVANAGRDAIRRWLRDPKHSTLDHRLRRLIREHQPFLPEMASHSRELALLILTTNRGNVICPYHHRWDKAGAVVDGKGKYKINGVPYSRHVSKTKRQRVKRPEGHLHCGCEEDAVLMDFYFWKTWEITSANGSRVEGLGDDMFKPRTRAFVTSQVTDLTGLVAEDFFRRGLPRREFEKKRVLVQLEYLVDYLNDVCQPENEVYSLNVTQATSTT
ncbi:hypothetical protein H0H92_012654 [Tricholoma furcatifolium]|nr:hypothetical protein H0H92_012654 [Tricholoma furcatifolium]